MKQTLLVAAIVSGLGISARTQAITLTFTANLEADNTTFPSVDPLNNAPFGGNSTGSQLNPDFRVIGSGSVFGGGEKQTSPGVSWVFDDGTGNLTSVSGSDVTTGCTNYCTTAGGTVSANSSGDTGLFKDSPFLTSKAMNFLAPTLGSAAGSAYGAGTISGDTDGNGTFSIFFPVLEGQWEGSIRTLGLNNSGVSFNCTSSSGSFHCQAERQLSVNDETLGFAGKYFQWDMIGTMSAVPVPAAAWLFASGLVGLYSLAHRKKV